MKSRPQPGPTLKPSGGTAENEAVRHSPLISVYAVLTIVTIAAAGAALAGGWYHDDACGIEQWKCDLGTYGFTAFFLSLFSGAAALVWVVAEMVIRAFRQARPRQRSQLSDLRTGVLMGLALQAAAVIVLVMLAA